jgi:hypothetical protein
MSEAPRRKGPFIVGLPFWTIVDKSRFDPKWPLAVFTTLNDSKYGDF